MQHGESATRRRSAELSVISLPSGTRACFPGGRGVVVAAGRVGSPEFGGLLGSEGTCVVVEDFAPLQPRLGAVTAGLHWRNKSIRSRPVCV